MFACRLYHLHFTHGSISMDELASLFGLLGLAVRHSDMVEAVENPYALATTPSDQLTMPDDVAKFFSSEKFLTALVEVRARQQRPFSSPGPVMCQRGSIAVCESDVVRPLSFAVVPAAPGCGGDGAGTDVGQPGAQPFGASNRA
jgi:hypothetical protein